MDTYLNVFFQLGNFVSVFLLGAIFTSALECFIDRKNTGESWMKGRSHCDFCGHTLTWWEVFPVTGTLILHGECRYCHKKFGYQHAIDECVIGLIYASIYACYGFSWCTLFYLAAISLEVAIIFYITKCTHQRRQ